MSEPRSLWKLLAPHVIPLFAITVCLVVLIVKAVAGEIVWVVVMAYCIAVNGGLLGMTIADHRSRHHRNGR